MAEAAPQTIGEVINTLRPEFPEITVSKIRFLEGQDLVKPQRSPSGYRQFTQDDVDRIRYILRQQRDHYLPLKVIKSKLAAWEQGLEPDDDLPEGAPPEAYFADAGVSMSKPELAKATGLSAAQIDSLVEHSVLEPMRLDDGKEVFRDEDIIVAKAARRLLRHGLEPRHLRAFRMAVDREASLLSNLTAPMLGRRDPENRRRAAEILADTAQAGRAMAEAMLRAELRKMLGG